MCRKDPERVEEEVSFVSLKEDVMEGIATNPANFNYFSKHHHNNIPSNSIPSNSIPSNSIPSNSILSNSIPSNSIPSNNSFGLSTQSYSIHRKKYQSHSKHRTLSKNTHLTALSHTQSNINHRTSTPSNPSQIIDITHSNSTNNSYNITHSNSTNSYNIHVRYARNLSIQPFSELVDHLFRSFTRPITMRLLPATRQSKSKTRETVV